MSAVPAASFLTVKQVADHLAISRGTVYAMVKAGIIKSIPIGAGSKKQHFRILKADLESYLRQQTNQQS